MTWRLDSLARGESRKSWLNWYELLFGKRRKQTKFFFFQKRPLGKGMAGNPPPRMGPLVTGRAVGGKSRCQRKDCSGNPLERLESVEVSRTKQLDGGH